MMVQRTKKTKRILESPDNACHINRVSDPKQPSEKSELEEAMSEAVEAVEKRQTQGESATNPGPKSLEDVKAELEAVIEKTKQDVADVKDKWLRAAADLENYRKRAAREREDVVRFANERLLKDLLPVLDDLDRSLAAVSASDGAAFEQILEGVKMVQRKFLTQLEKNGVTTFESTGKVFDPLLHEAVQQVPSSEIPPGGVVQELRRGYMLNGRLLRPAMVAVSIGPETTAEGTN